MIEHCRKLYGMSTFHHRNRRLNRKEIVVGIAARLGLVLRQSEERRNKHELVEQAAGIFIGFSLDVVAEALHQCLLFICHLGHFLRLTVGSPFIPIRAKAPNEIIHFVLVASVHEVDIFCSTVGVGLIRVQRQEVAVSFRPCAQSQQSICNCHQLAYFYFLQVGNGTAAQLSHEFVRAGDGLFCRSREYGRTALGNDALEILLGAFDQRQQGHATCTGGFAEDGHVVGIAVEGRDVLVYPLQRHQLVHKSQVLCIGVVGTVRQVRQV